MHTRSPTTATARSLCRPDGAVASTGWPGGQSKVRVHAQSSMDSARSSPGRVFDSKMRRRGGRLVISEGSMYGSSSGRRGSTVNWRDAGRDVGAAAGTAAAAAVPDVAAPRKKRAAAFRAAATCRRWRTQAGAIRGANGGALGEIGSGVGGRVTLPASGSVPAARAAETCAMRTRKVADWGVVGLASRVCVTAVKTSLCDWGASTVVLSRPSGVVVKQLPLPSLLRLRLSRWGSLGD